MAYTETVHQSYGSRLGGSVKGIGAGIVMFLIGTGLLWWNEGRTVKQQQANEGAAAITVEMPNIASVDSSFEGKVVHATGMAETKDVRADDIFGISENTIQLVRSVEYYQYVEHKSSQTKENLGGSTDTTYTYTYKPEWTGSAVNSADFKDPDYQMKNSVLVAGLDSKTTFADNVSFGAYELPKAMFKKIDANQDILFDAADTAKLTQIQSNLGLKAAEVPAAVTAPAPAQQPADGQAAAPAAAAAPTEAAAAPAAQPAAASQKVHVIDEGKTLYLGSNPGKPEIGDMKVSFKKAPASIEVSLIAQVTGKTFKPWKHEKNGYEFSAFNTGKVEKEAMFKAAEEANTMMCWILRIVGIILVISGISTVLKPLSVLASVVPFLGKVVGAGTGIIAKIFGLGWSFLVIAVAWIFYRPLVGIALLVVTGGLAFVIISKLKGAKAPAPAPADGANGPAAPVA